MRSNKEYLCRICGYEYETQPWGEDGNTPIYEICPCCGVEFGYEDATINGIIVYRNNWIKNGAEWNNKKMKPEEWDINLQLSKAMHI